MTKHPSDSSSSHREGATIRIHHRVRASARDRYETWLRQIIETAARFPGHLGVHILRPPEGGQDYEIAVRFSNEEDARRWRESEQRRELMATIHSDLQQDETVEILSGIDYWFTPPNVTSKQPTRWKQWLVTTAVIWPLTMLIPLLWQPLFSLSPTLGAWGLRHGLIAATIVALMVYAVMPRVTRILAPWLFR